MVALTFLFLLVVYKATTISGECDESVCGEADFFTSSCGEKKETLDCIIEILVPNMDCSIMFLDFLRGTWYISQVIRNCSDFNIPEDCDLRSCFIEYFSAFSIGDFCNFTEKTISCARELALNEISCSSIKSVTYFMASSVQLTNEMMKCPTLQDGVTALTASLSLSLTLSGVTYFLMSFK